MSTLSRFATAIARTKGDAEGAQSFVQNTWPRDTGAHALTTKAAVAPTGYSNIQDSPAAAEFLEAIRPHTLLGRMSGYRIARLNTRVLRATSTPRAYVIGEGVPIPVAAMSLATTLLTPIKLGSLVVMSDEVIKGDPGTAERAVQGELSRAVIAARDVALFDPAAVGSVTNGTANVINGGASSTAIQVAANIDSLMDTMSAAGCPFERPFWLTSARLRGHLAVLRTTTGAPAFPEINDGMLAGFPLLSSGSISHSTSGGGPLVLIDASRLTFAEGGADVAVGVDAAVQLSDTPTVGATTAVSLWSNNLVSLRVIQYLAFFLGDASCVGYIDQLH